MNKKKQCVQLQLGLFLKKKKNHKEEQCSHCAMKNVTLWIKPGIDRIVDLKIRSVRDLGLRLDA